MGRPQPITFHRAHDYGHLIRRWRSVCRARGLCLTAYTAASGYDIYVAEPRKPLPSAPWVYLSAAIHGDEAAASEGLLHWAAASATLAARVNLLIFPCLNPWGLVNNMRTDADGRDLNRTYHDDSVPQTAAHKRLLAGRSLHLALLLHEDYDANGIYIYELKSRLAPWAEDLLAAAAPHVPIDTRKSIEGRASRNGVVRRSIKPETMPQHPEAFLLHFHHAARTFTVETPSEAHIDNRVGAHGAVIDRAVRRTLREIPEISKIYKRLPNRIFPAQ